MEKSDKTIRFECLQIVNEKDKTLTIDQLIESTNKLWEFINVGLVKSEVIVEEIILNKKDNLIEIRKDEKISENDAIQLLLGTKLINDKVVDVNYIESNTDIEYPKIKALETIINKHHIKHKYGNFGTPSGGTYGKQIVGAFPYENGHIVISSSPGGYPIPFDIPEKDPLSELYMENFKKSDETITLVE